jgi:hypothetical protein
MSSGDPDLQADGGAFAGGARYSFHGQIPWYSRFAAFPTATTERFRVIDGKCYLFIF